MHITCNGGCMTGMCKALMFLAIVIGLSASGFGQWLLYPTADVPRKADGSPDLTAPTPRLPDGKPDLSGIWRPGRRNPCTTTAGRSVECGTGLGGSSLVRN